MDLSCDYKVCSLLLVEALQIRDMLEIVGIDLSAVYDLVGLYIVLKYLDLQIIAFFSQKGLCGLKDLSVRCRACSNGDRLALFRRSLIA